MDTNGARPLLDDIVLNCVFQPRYMTLDMCIRLEPTSTLFATKADQFYRNLKQLDVKEFVVREKQVNWSRKIFNRCPNLKSVENFTVAKESLKRDMVCLQLISLMKSIFSVGVVFHDHFSPSDMFPMIGMANLNHLSLYTSHAPVDIISFNLLPVEKLRVTSLKCDALYFMDLCFPDHLNVLHLEFTEVGINELIEKLFNFRNMKKLTVRLKCPDNAEELLSLVNFVSDVLLVDAFSLQPFSWLKSEFFLNICDQTAFEKCITYLWLENIDSEYVPNILKFQNLQCLWLTNVTFSMDVFLKSLPNLHYLAAENHYNVESAQGGAILCFKSIFNRGYFICFVVSFNEVHFLNILQESNVSNREISTKFLVSCP